MSDYLVHQPKAFLSDCCFCDPLSQCAHQQDHQPASQLVHQPKAYVILRPFKSVHPPAGPPASQPASQPAKAASQPDHQPASQPARQQANQTASQPASQLASQTASAFSTFICLRVQRLGERFWAECLGVSGVMLSECLSWATLWDMHKPYRRQGLVGIVYKTKAEVICVTRSEKRDLHNLSGFVGIGNKKAHRSQVTILLLFS